MMKRFYLFACVASLLGFVSASNAFAGKAEKKVEKKDAGATATLRSDVYVSFDKNFDGKLDDAEKDDIRKCFEAEKLGFLKVWDKNSDGKLSDSELNAIPATKPADKPVKATKKPDKAKKNK